MLLVTLFACAQPAEKATANGSVITWSDDVTLDADFTVPEGTTLVIEHGVTVTLSEDVALLVDGELNADGGPAHDIVFTGDANARWRSIVFSKTGTPATFTDVDDYDSGSILTGVTIENATRAVELAGASPYLENVVFRNNAIPATVDTIGGAAILIADGATPRIRLCTFSANVANTFAFGGAIYVDAANPILQDNSFTNNVGSYGGAISTNNMASPIVGSQFTSNESASEGGAISLVSTVSALLANDIEGNHAKADGAGVHVCLDCDPHAAPTLYDNIVAYNLSDNDDPADGAAGIGAAFLGGLHTNDIHDNLRNGEPSDFAWYNLSEEAWPDWVSTPDIGDNWWDTTDADAIAATIFDGNDDPTYASVDASWVRDANIGAPIPRVVMAPRRMHYMDAGDTIAVYLTLYNPGPAATFSLDLRERGNPFPGSLAFPGASQKDGIWTFVMPENSVWFGTIDESTYDGTSVDDIEWMASLLDATSGEMIGRTSVARYVLSPADGT